jgi:MarR family 2-MHQ and catechol resistance regulon transcriptional repressor
MGTHYKGKPEEVLALDTYIKLMRAADTLTHRLNSTLDANDLTISQFGVLEALLHLGPLHLSVLAEKLLRTGGNLTLVARNLQKRGLVQKKQEGSDRRYYTLHLTPKGEQMIRRIFNKHVKLLTREFSVLNAADQRQLGRLCKRLGRHLQTL